jgi:hypothetical protein
MNFDWTRASPKTILKIAPRRVAIKTRTSRISARSSSIVKYGDMTLQLDRSKVNWNSSALGLWLNTYSEGVLDHLEAEIHVTRP